jgi:hypothetical protein
MIKARMGRWVAISFDVASMLQVPGRCMIDSSKSDDMVWIDKRRFARQIRRWVRSL